MYERAGSLTRPVAGAVPEAPEAPVVVDDGLEDALPGGVVGRIREAAAQVGAATLEEELLEAGVLVYLRGLGIRV